MSLEHAYASLEALKARLGLQVTDTRDDEALEGILEAVSRVIDAECFDGGESHFYATDDDEVRYFTASCAGELAIDDLLELTSLATDVDGDGVYEVTWAAADSVLAPYNAQALTIPRPYRRLEVPRLGPNWFPVGVRRGVRVTGSWGWCTATNRPKQVEAVCLRESLYAFTAAKTPYGMTTGDGSTAVAPAPSLSAYSKLLLFPFRRVSVA